MDTSNESNRRVPMLEVKYKNNFYRFYNKIDYDNWLKTIPDGESVSEEMYYKGLGTHIYRKNL
jgi:hypothetical protein